MRSLCQACLRSSPGFQASPEPCVSTILVRREHDGGGADSVVRPVGQVVARRAGDGNTDGSRAAAFQLRARSVTTRREQRQSVRPWPPVGIAHS